MTTNIESRNLERSDTPKSNTQNLDLTEKAWDSIIAYNTIEFAKEQE